jgi:hypothetical protein
VAPAALEEYPIECLNRAIVDEEANVTLADAEETRLFQVKLHPTEFSDSWTMREKQLLRLILKYMGVEVGIINYATLPPLARPDLKLIKGYIDDQRQLDPSILPASLEFMRQTLLKVGMRRPRHGRRAA